MWSSLPLELKRRIFEQVISLSLGSPRNVYMNYYLVNQEWFNEVVAIFCRRYGATVMVKRWQRGLLDMNRLNTVYFSHQSSLIIREPRCQPLVAALQGGLMLPSLYKLEYFDPNTLDMDAAGYDCQVLSFIVAPKLKELIIEINGKSMEYIGMFLRTVEKLVKQCASPPVIRLTGMDAPTLGILGERIFRPPRFFKLVKSVEFDDLNQDGVGVATADQLGVVCQFPSVEGFALGSFMPKTLVLDWAPNLAVCSNLRTIRVGLVTSIGMQDAGFFVSMLERLCCQLEILDMRATHVVMTRVMNQFSKQRVHFSQLHTLELYIAFHPDHARGQEVDPVKMIGQLAQLASPRLKALAISGLVADTVEAMQSIWEEFRTRMVRFNKLDSLVLHIDRPETERIEQFMHELAIATIGLVMPNLRTLELEDSKGMVDVCRFQYEPEVPTTRTALFPELVEFDGMRSWLGFHTDPKNCFRQFVSQHFPKLDMSEMCIDCLHCELQVLADADA